MRTFLSKTLRSLVVVAVISLGLFLWAYHTPHFEVAELSLEGTKRLDPQELLKLTTIEPGRNQLQINLREEAARLVSHPMVAQVEVARRGFRGVLFKVTEESPASVVAGKQRLGLSLGGRVLPHQLCEGFSPLPILTAPSVSSAPFQRLKEPEVLYALDFYRRFLKLSPLWAGKVSEISTSRSGDLLVSFSPKQLAINFGRGMFDEKIQRLSFILKQNPHFLKEIRSIDLRVPDQVFVFHRGG